MEEKRRHTGKKTLAQKIQERDELLKLAHARIDGFTISQLRRFLAAKGPKKETNLSPEPLAAQAFNRSKENNGH